MHLSRKLDTFKLPLRFLNRLRRIHHKHVSLLQYYFFPGLRVRAQNQIYKAVVSTASAYRRIQAQKPRKGNQGRGTRAGSGARRSSWKRLVKRVLGGGGGSESDKNMQTGTQSWGEYLGGSGEGGSGGKRAKLAGFLQAATKAASEAKQSYYSRTANGNGTSRGIEGDWGDAEVATNGEEQLVLFPSYARWTPPRNESRTWRAPAYDDIGGVAEGEDRESMIDVDVRGWVFRPNSGPPSRTQRMAIGIAKTLCGLPALPTDDGQSGRTSTESSWRNQYSASGSNSQIQTMSNEEIHTAHAELTARLAPFLYEAVAEKKITILIYNDETSTMIETYTCSKGHFSYRAAVHFIPTDVKVFVTADLSLSEPVRIVGKSGISLISDIDDTIKHSAVHLGTREMFRNTFVKPLDDLVVQGVKEWYTSLASPPYNVEMHYVSNSPWQLFSLLENYMRRAGLPQGSFHLKQYSGLLKGIFEPVADRKRGSLERIIRDFPGRKWILVGDSGEMDLEVYTEVALQFPGRILAIFIRDVASLNSSSTASLSRSLPNTSSEELLFQNDFFNSSQSSSPSLNESKRAPPIVPPPRRANVTSNLSSSPSTGANTPRSPLPEIPQQPKTKPEVPPKKAPPARPPKPKALQVVQNSAEADGEGPKPALPERRTTEPVTATIPKPSSSSPTLNGPFPPPPKRRTLPPPFVPGSSTTPPPRNSSPYSAPLKTASSTSLPLPAHTPTSQQQQAPPPLFQRPTYATTTSGRYPGSYTDSQPMTAEERKRELWLMRWNTAARVLESQGVILESWTIGSDVAELSRSIVESALTADKGHGDRSRR